MDYGDIRRNIQAAGRLVGEGKVGEADTLIRSMIGQGMTANDVRSNLDKDTMRALREYSRYKTALANVDDEIEFLKSERKADPDFWAANGGKSAMAKLRRQRARLAEKVGQ